MAQAHRRLGSKVTVLEREKILPRDDSELVEILRNRLSGEGVAIRDGVDVTGVERAGQGVAVLLQGGERIEGSHLLVAAGRSPNIEGLGLDLAGIAYDRKGIKVDAGLRTTNRKVYAIGDCAGGPQFTHIAGYHAGIVIRRALFRLPARVDYRALPWVTYADPELAQAGQTEAQAREEHGDLRVLRSPLRENDRAQTERRTEGMVKIVTKANGQVIGASILAPHAGELIQLWVLAIGQKMKIGAVANMIAPYPTLGEAGKRAAGSFYTGKLFSERTRKLVRLLSWFG
jgi:pyruvate/2-oxoglutarate dehydrogenase complex dihydrolipoamide dehydrogenase (E3) component